MSRDAADVLLNPISKWKILQLTIFVISLRFWLKKPWLNLLFLKKKIIFGSEHLKEQIEMFWICLTFLIFGFRISHFGPTLSRVQTSNCPGIFGLLFMFMCSTNIFPVLWCFTFMKDRFKITNIFKITLEIYIKI